MSTASAPRRTHSPVTAPTAAAMAHHDMSSELYVLRECTEQRTEDDEGCLVFVMPPDACSGDTEPGYVSTSDASERSQQAISLGSRQGDGLFIVQDRDSSSSTAMNDASRPNASSRDAGPCNLTVAGLPRSVDSPRLAEAFRRFGNVLSAMVMLDTHSGRSRGFGFVWFANKEEAHGAVEQLHGAPVSELLPAAECESEEQSRTLLRAFPSARADGLPESDHVLITNWPGQQLSEADAREAIVARCGEVTALEFSEVSTQRKFPVCSILATFADVQSARHAVSNFHGVRTLKLASGTVELPLPLVTKLGAPMPKRVTRIEPRRATCHPKPTGTPHPVSATSVLVGPPPATLQSTQSPTPPQPAMPRLPPTPPVMPVLPTPPGAAYGAAAPYGAAYPAPPHMAGMPGAPAYATAASYPPYAPAPSAYAHPQYVVTHGPPPPQRLALPPAQVIYLQPVYM